ncbi:MAG: DUF5667 domain-containing protein [Patescibacteria group bacterium]
MDNLEKILNNLPKNKLSRRADLKIKFQLYRLLVSAYLKRLFIFNHELSFFNKGLVAAMVLVLIFSATSIFAYASDSVVPGNIIYPLKKAVEKLEQNIAPSKTAKIAAYEKQSVRRLEEAVNLSQKNSSTTPAAKNVKTNVSDNIEKNISEVVDNQQAVLESINKLGDYQKASAAAFQAKEADKAKSEYLDKIAEYAELSDDNQMLELVNQAQNIINNQKYKYQGEELNDDEKEDEQEDKGDNHRGRDNEGDQEDNEADKRSNNGYNKEKP